MGGIDIGLSKEITILGLPIDHKLTFHTHITNACKKAIGIYNKLARMARVSWGIPPKVIRVIYLTAVEPTILYGASSWYVATNGFGVRK